MNPADILDPTDREKSNAYLVNKLREAVKSWRDSGYPGTTDTTKRLLNYWFYEDHIIDNMPFEFWFAQREAIETLIYVYEVMKKRTFIDLAKDFGNGPINFSYDPKIDLYPLYGFKMATGSGKTVVMSLAIVWQLFNHHFENKDDYTSKFLIIAGDKNVIYDRLKRDYQDAKIFREMPLIPPEWNNDFDLKVILKEDPINTIYDSVLFLTNIQQLQDKAIRKEEVERFIDDILELKEVNKTNIAKENRIKEVLEKTPNIMILKDEAHHIYNYERKWKSILLKLHKHLESQYGKGILAELDFSATPRSENGNLFYWLIVDFTLKEAIDMNIVKRPLKGMVSNASEVSSKDIVERYRAWIDAGIRRWQEYKNVLSRLNKKPILFFQCPNNREADKLKDYLETIPEARGKILLIHTDSTGDISKSDIERARDAARDIDSEDNHYEVIVSTMMLNEGWDVRNVNIIVGLRSYTSKRKVLPEQVIGRGLRKMFPDLTADTKHSINVLEIIGPPGLMEIIEDLEMEENIKFDTVNVDSKIDETDIHVEKNKIDKDIEIPILSPRITIGRPNIDMSILDRLPALSLPLENKILKTEYKAIDMVKNTVEVERIWDLPVPKDSKSVIAYYTDIILRELRLPNSFSELYPIVKAYVETKLFDQKVDLNDPRVLYQLSSTETKKKLVDLFVESLKANRFTETEPTSYYYIRLSDIEPFPKGREVYKAEKCIFNLVPCDNGFELEFSKFLDRAEDVISFCKIVPKIGFSVEYIDSKGNLRYYYPDFIVVLKDANYIVEAKGEVDENVRYKDERIKRWCEDASKITKRRWKYIRVNQIDFENYSFNTFEELVKTLSTDRTSSK
ncbi:MAG: type III restriction protein res subunit [Candidatus Micrarchaeota archaeon]|nr:MAG: type III restriction protein res subunit [Candidatus Micrarchaeota archaeon]